ncbi:hypothetical protein, partial [Streptomyces populi]|uniref:hypothetical protein n=1 Tax=Streptomyces populi TaxID=2058924 RepID=UPI0019D1A7F1
PLRRRGRAAHPARAGAELFAAYEQGPGRMLRPWGIGLLAPRWETGRPPRTRGSSGPSTWHAGAAAHLEHAGPDPSPARAGGESFAPWT